MILELLGKIRGKQIELEQETGLPLGSVVKVRLQPQALSLVERQALVDSLCGAWANDSSIGSIFADIANQRALISPRATAYHVAS